MISQRHLFIFRPSRRELELSFFPEAVLRHFLEYCHAKSNEEKWQKWSIESSIVSDIVNIIVKLWTGRVSDHDVETCLKRYCKILDGPDEVWRPGTQGERTRSKAGHHQWTTTRGRQTSTSCSRTFH